ncbi:MAG: AAA family ATPase [Pirellulales bacterium]|nr:AAA family ATPase [Pirellulales bacterium]
MFEKFFQLTRRPFAAAPEPEFYFPAAAIEEARHTLARSIERAEGTGLLIGSTGTGKSLLCRSLAEQFRGQLEVALLAGAQLATRRALLQAVLFELSLPYRGMDEGELRLQLIDHLTRRNESTPGLLLIVDEAQTLPQRLLEELRLITNIVRQGELRVRLVVAGGPALEERFATPQLESFSQRIAARCYLRPFVHAETLGYVAHQIERSGGDSARIFEPDALDAIHRATDGIPRLVNQLCDHALVLAYTAGVKKLDAKGIEEAWADLQQLPLPWREMAAASQESATREAADVIEFGGLEDDFEFEPAHADGATIHAPTGDYAETVAHLEQLETHVDAMADEFRPVGSIRPEVEFVLPELIRSQDQAFDEEEVILDRYAELDATSWAGLPQVSSREGRELSRLLERYARRTEMPLRQEPRRAKKTASRPPADAVEPPARHLGSVAEAPLAEPAKARVIALPPQEPAVHATPAEEADLIVVEEDAAAEEVAISRPIAPVRRQEFRQLFARLRRG